MKFFIRTFGEVPAINLLHILAIMLVVFGVSFGLWLWLGDGVLVAMLALLIGLALIVLSAVAFGNHQLEALGSIHGLIDPRAPLPTFRSWNISPDLAAEVAGLIIERKPRLMVELGAGVSSVVAGYVMEATGEGRIVGVDHNATFATLTRATLARHRLDERVTVRHAPLTPVQVGEAGTWQWYDPAAFEDLHDIDLLFIDGPPNTTQRLVRYPALPMLMDRLSDDAVIVLDDAARLMERRAIRRWQRQFPELEVVWLGTKGGGVAMFPQRQ